MQHSGSMTTNSFYKLNAYALCGFYVQARYADGTKKMLECWFDEKEFPEKWYIVREGELAPQYK